MKCEDVYLHICDHLDEDISSPRCRMIREHLDACPNCQAYLDSLKKTITLYKAIPEPSVPAQTHKQLFKAISVLTTHRQTPVKPNKRSKGTTSRHS